MVKGARIIPIMSTQIALRRVWDTAGGDDDTEDNEPDDCHNLDDREHELGLSVTCSFLV
jgi:hypothetical protein